MTNLNTAIAVSKGWKCHTTNDEFGINETWFTPRNTPSIYNRIPDYEHDANLYMSLFEEMSSEFFLLTLMQHDYDNKTIITGDYRQGHNENIPQFIVESQPIGTAICLAYAKWKGIEVVG